MHPGTYLKLTMAIVGWITRIVVVFVLVGHASAAAGGRRARLHREDYHFEYSFLDDTIIPYQNLWLRLEMTNVTDHEVPRPSTMPGGSVFYFSIVHDTGGYVDVPMPHFDGDHITYGTLHSREQVIVYLGFGQFLWQLTTQRVRASLVGKRLGLSVSLRARAFADGPSRRTESTVIPFWVVAPSAEDVEATSLLRRAEAGLGDAGRGKKDYQAARTLSRQLLTRFPDSPLVERAIHLLDYLEIYHPLGTERPSMKRVELFHELATLMPMSPELIIMAREIKSGFGVQVYDSLLADLERREPTAPALEVLNKEKDR